MNATLTYEADGGMVIYLSGNNKYTSMTFVDNQVILIYHDSVSNICNSDHVFELSEMEKALEGMLEFINGET